MSIYLYIFKNVFSSFSSGFGKGHRRDCKAVATDVDAGLRKQFGGSADEVNIDIKVMVPKLASHKRSAAEKTKASNLQIITLPIYQKGRNGL